MTLFEALTGGAFDRLNWQHSGEFDQIFSKKSNAPGFARGEGEGGFGIDWYIKFVCYRNTQLQIVMVDTCEHISWPQGRPSHLQFLQPFEEVLEGLERATILPVKGK